MAKGSGTGIMYTETKQARLCLILAVAGAVIALFFAGLWQFARHDRSDLARAAQEEAAVCRDAWKKYEETGAESDAAQALASLYTFSREMEQLTEETSRADYAVYCRNVFRLLTEKPELCRVYASAVEKQIGLIAGDIYHLNAYAELSKLADKLESGIVPETETESDTGTDGGMRAVGTTGGGIYA